MIEKKAATILYCSGVPDKETGIGIDIPEHVKIEFRDKKGRRCSIYPNLHEGDVEKIKNIPYQRENDPVEAGNPMQPIVLASDGCIRFKSNSIVDRLLKESQERGFGLNELCCQEFPQEDWDQFNQLIGYSVSGYGDLSLVSDESKMRSSDVASKLAKCRSFQP